MTKIMYAFLGAMAQKARQACHWILLPECYTIGIVISSARGAVRGRYADSTQQRRTSTSTPDLYQNIFGYFKQQNINKVHPYLIGLSGWRARGKHRGDLKGTLAVQFNFCLQSFSLYILLIVGLLLPVSPLLQNGGGSMNFAHGLHESGHEDCGWVSEMSPGSWWRDPVEGGLEVSLVIRGS